jgi:L-amino acid N-acyltransferase
MLICDAVEDDVPEILVIYNQIVKTSTAIYRDDPVSLEDRVQWCNSRQQKGYPVLVAKDTSGVLGYSSFDDFRGPSGYRFTIEHTVHVREESRGKGVGQKLVEALFPFAKELRKHVMIGAIDAENEGSIRFHLRLGFIQTGLLHEVGFKFNRWLDLAILQKLI